MGDDGAWILWLTAAVAVVLFVLLGLAQKAKARKQYGEGGVERITAAWNRLGVALNGTVKWPARGPNEHSPEPVMVPTGLDMTTLGVEVRVSGGPEESSQEKLFWFDASADCEVPAWLRMAVRYRAGEESLDASVRDADDASITTGDAEFDDRYEVTSNVPDIAWALLDDGTLSRILSAAEFHVSVSNERARAWAKEQPVEPEQLRHAIEAVARLARSFNELSTRWARITTSVSGDEPSSREDIEQDWTAVFGQFESGMGVRIDVSSWTPFGETPPHWIRTRVVRPLSEQLPVGQLALFRRARVVETDWGDETCSRPAVVPVWAEGLPEVEVGRDAFGEAFEVRAGKPATAHQRLGHELRDAVLRIAPEALVVQRSALEISLPGLVLDSQRLQDSKTLLALIAEGGAQQKD